MRLRTLFGIGALATLAAAVWWRRNPSACPYNQRFWVQAPHPFITRARLLEALALAPHERVLEVGPGTGYYTFDMAAALSQGQVDVFDIQQEMLDHVMRAAEQRGVTNLRPMLGDAQNLPYPDDTFDAAVLVTVLGEIPDQEQALHELARVLKPGGRLVVGELFGDPHMVTSGRLRERAGHAGLGFERRLGNPLAFFERFEAPLAGSV
jgi:SAM-dependent methyltransferase